MSHVGCSYAALRLGARSLLVVLCTLALPNLRFGFQSAEAVIDRFLRCERHVGRQRSRSHGDSAQHWRRAEMLAATALSLALALAPQAPPSLKPCKGESDCISSNGLEAPNHFQAPLAFAPKTRDKAFTDAARLLRDECTAVDDGAACCMVMTARMS